MPSTRKIDIQTTILFSLISARYLKDKAFTEEVITSITHIKGLTIEPLKSEDFTKAVDLMQEYRLDYEDSINLAVAVRKGAQEILSNDKDFDTAPIKRNI